MWRRCVVVKNSHEMQGSHQKLTCFSGLISCCTSIKSGITPQQIVLWQKVNLHGVVKSVINHIPTSWKNLLINGGVAVKMCARVVLLERSQCAPHYNSPFWRQHANELPSDTRCHCSQTSIYPAVRTKKYSVPIDCKAVEEQKKSMIRWVAYRAMGWQAI